MPPHLYNCRKLSVSPSSTSLRCLKSRIRADWKINIYTITHFDFIWYAISSSDVSEVWTVVKIRQILQYIGAWKLALFSELRLADSFAERRATHGLEPVMSWSLWSKYSVMSAVEALEISQWVMKVRHPEHTAPTAIHLLVSGTTYSHRRGAESMFHCIRNTETRINEGRVAPEIWNPWVPGT